MKLSDLDHLRQNPQIRFKNEVVDGKNFTIVSYMISSTDLWDVPLATEARGITFDFDTGACVCRPLEKFFNYGERPLIGTPVPELVLEKKDGSMITPVIVNGKVYLKTKKSFYSDAAQFAQKNLTPDIEEFCHYCHEQGITPIFELTSPQNRIVVDYGQDVKFTLIAARKTETGELLTHDQLKELIMWCHDIRLIAKFDLTWDQILENAKTKTGIEGYVVYLKDRLIKVKTKWYLSLHHTMTDLRERDIAEAVILETVDDIKSLVSASGVGIEKIEEIETRVIGEINSIKKEVESLNDQVSGMTPKEIAVKYKDHPLFHLLIILARGHLPNYREFWKKTRLKDCSLEVVYNPSFSKK